MFFRLCKKFCNEKCDQNDYRYLQKLVLARVMSFNARRGGEVSKLTWVIREGVEDDRWKRRSHLDAFDDVVDLNTLNILCNKYQPKSMYSACSQTMVC